MSNGILSSAVSTSYNDKKGDTVRISHEVARKAGRFEGVLQIPFYRGGVPALLSFVHGSELQIPNETHHTIQRRFVRISGLDLPEKDALSLASSSTRVQAGGLSLTSALGDRGKLSSVVVEGEGVPPQKIYP